MFNRGPGGAFFWTKSTGLKDIEALRQIIQDGTTKIVIIRHYFPLFLDIDLRILNLEIILKIPGL
jgi:hypothetical protein